jgi:hypothetical protein
MWTRHGYKTAKKTKPEYVSWSSMIQRCENVNHKSYTNYGGRGITVCKEWREDFNNFLADMGPKPTKKHSLERKNNDEGYNPQNCIWSLMSEQSRNKRNNVFLEVNGKLVLMGDYAKMCGITYQAASKRVQRARKSAGDGCIKLLDGTIVPR